MAVAILKLYTPPLYGELCIEMYENVGILKLKYLNFVFTRK